MKEIKTKRRFEVELTEEEVIYLRDIMQNALQNETQAQKKIRQGIFTSSMRLLGYDIDANGKILRSYSQNKKYTNESCDTNIPDMDGIK